MGMPSKSDINPVTNQPYAVNPASGNWDDNWWANVVEPQLKRQYGVASSSGGGQSVDAVAEARKLVEFQREANLPAIASLQAQRQETGQRFETEATRLSGQKEPLKQRYQNILNELTRREKVDVGQTERVVSREFGRRGIPLSSGLFDVELQEKTQPIREFYTGQTKETGLAQEQALSGIEGLIASLPQQSTAEQRQITNAMAGLQSGDPNAALQSAITLQKMAEERRQFEASQELQQQQMAADISYREKELASKQPNTEVVNIGGRAKLINSTTGAVISDLGPSGSPSIGTADERLSAVKQDFLNKSASGNYSLKDLMKQFGAKIPYKEMLEGWTAVSPWGAPNEPEFRQALGLKDTSGMNYSNL